MPDLLAHRRQSQALARKRAAEAGGHFRGQASKERRGEHRDEDHSDQEASGLGGEQATGARELEHHERELAP